MREILHIHGDQCGNQIGARANSNVSMSTSTNSRCCEEGS
uniref:Uncharacterized protein n=1 Tax=Brassica campestris TaxID=3711 RepID=A0A3P5YU55_BRACM|nr:unnamed protein product [Brassica rapa]